MVLLHHLFSPDQLIHMLSLKIDTTNNYASLDSIKLQKRDRIIVKKDLSKLDKYNVEVNGMVRKPGVFSYHENMTLADAIILADGFKMEAASNRIEIARVANFDKAIAQSVPTQMSILSFSIGKNIGTDELANSTLLQPYDQIFVRPTPEFEFQTKVSVLGEVMYPGDYVLVSKDEKLTSLIDRAGGLTRFAYPKGARLFRKTDGIGYVLMDLDKAIKRKNSKFNYILNKGDSIVIPTEKDLVVLQGEFNYPTKKKPESLYMPFASGKNFRYYIKTYGAGFGKDAKRLKTYVTAPNGRVQKGRKASIEKGSIITIPPKDKKEKKKKEKDEPGSEARYNAMKTINIMIGTIASAVTTTVLLMSLIKK